MTLKHCIRINVRDDRGNRQPLIHGCTAKLPGRLITWLFGDFREVIVLTPGKTVDALEIQEIRPAGTKGGRPNEQHE